MSSSVFTESASRIPAADGNSNLVVVYSKNGISFDNAGIDNVMEEKSISTISIVRLTSPTPSMVEEEEAERLEELERFENATDMDDSERDTDEDNRSVLDEVKSDKDHITGDDNNENSGIENNDDSAETDADAPKVRKRPGRKPKVVKQKKRRKPKERPPIVGLSVEQFYTDSTADLVVKNALKLAGLSVFKRTAESIALLEIIKSDHNYTPFLSPEQRKLAEKLANEKPNKLVLNAPGNTKVLAIKKRPQATPFSPVQAVKQPQQQHQPSPKETPKLVTSVLIKMKRAPRSSIKPVSATEEPKIQDDEDANSSANGENVDADKSCDSEEYEQLSEISDESRETDNDRDSDIDFKMTNTRYSGKRKRVKKFGRRTQAQGGRLAAQVSRPHQPVGQLKRRVRSQERLDGKHIDQSLGNASLSSSTKVLIESQPTTTAARVQSIQLLKTRPVNKSMSSATKTDSSNKPCPPLTPEPARLALTPTSLAAQSSGSKVRRTPIVQVATVQTTSSGSFLTPPQDVKEILINKNLSSPKGVFTNLNTLLGDNINSVRTPPAPSSPYGTQKERFTISHPSQISTPKSSTIAPHPLPTVSSSKGFMPIGVETAGTHKLPAQIVIETHQSSSELAAEHDKQLDLIDSIVQDELLKANLVTDQKPTTTDENIPKLVKMLESTAAGLDQTQLSTNTSKLSQFCESALSIANNTTTGTEIVQSVGDIVDIGNTPILDPPDVDNITADFLQHVVGLIEEDKQFEAEVVKQVLAQSVETPANLSVGASIDEIAKVVALPTDGEPIFRSVQPLVPNIATQQLTNDTNMQSEPITLSLPASLSDLPMASSTPSRGSVGSLQLQRPEVKIVRGNGRVIYLPPMEAPTTRAKRRAQNTTTTTTTITTTTSDDNRQSNDSFPMSSNSDNEGSVAALNVSQKSQDMSARKRNLSGTTGRGKGRRSVTGRRSKKMELSQANANDTEASESQENDDDPNKLWCICRQPHNNRFMICCDLCEDWYHGTCVNVTKVMGLDMEERGIDWKCPKCLKKQEEKTQPRITDMFMTNISSNIDSQPNDISDGGTAKSDQEYVLSQSFVDNTTATQLAKHAASITGKQQNRAGGGDSGGVKVQSKTMHQQQLNNFVTKLDGLSSLGSCIVCKRATGTPSSIYCSEDCIKKYAHTAISRKSPDIMQSKPAVTAVLTGAASQDAKKGKKKDLFEDVLRQADTLSKVERINVFERKSGRIISGNQAPTAHNLKKWLQDNPTYEVVQPGTVQAAEIEKLQAKRSNLLSESSNAGQVAVEQQSMQPEHSSKSSRMLGSGDTTPKSITPLSSQFVHGGKEKVPVKLKQKVASAKAISENVKRVNVKPQPIRLNVRRTLKDQLLSRIKEAQASNASEGMEWMTPEAVEQFSKSVESEMYHSFGCDVGSKYKLKYRSLMFNIKDRKNRTLFEKICAKQVDPKQLVKMSPAELASQELAKWREDENRHQLEIIKKSELDLLSASQKYLLKSHKGEELIKTKVDVILPDEAPPEKSDTLATSTSNKFDILNRENKISIALPPTSDQPAMKIKDKQCESPDKHKSKYKETDKKDKERERDRDKRHKSHKHNHHHSSKKRSRSRSGSRSRSAEKRHKNTGRREDRTQKETFETTPDKDSLHPELTNKQHIEETTVPEIDKTPIAKAVVENKSPVVKYNLIDQILESEKTVEEAANLVKLIKPSSKVKSSLPSSLPVVMPVFHTIPSDKYSHYVASLRMPPLWSGEISMVDVADFHVCVFGLHGQFQELGKLLPSKLDVIGRITRVNVWEYISKIRKSPTKEFVLCSIFPSSVAQSENFRQFFEYLDSRQRLGVLGSDPKDIRDFYIFPLGAGEKVPSVLVPPERIPFFEDVHRPDILLGIIVRCITKRSAVAAFNQQQPSTSPIHVAKAMHKSRPDTFSLTGSSKRKRSTYSTSSREDEIDIDAIIKAPIASKSFGAKAPQTCQPIELDQDNDPYSPGGSSNDDINDPDDNNKYDLKRQVDEIDKKIAAQEMEIAGLLKVDSTVLDKTKSASKVLAGISIPPNLSKILASIKDPVGGSSLPSAEYEYNPEDAMTSSSSYARAKLADKSNKKTSRLAQLSEAELLSMVPDDIA